MKSLLKKILVCCILCFPLVFTACEDDDPPAPPPATLGELVIADDNLSMLEDLMNKAAMNPVLTGDDPLTLFAPDNDAFTASGISQADIMALDQAQAQRFLQFHLLNGKIISADLPEGPNSKMQTLNGDTIFLSLYNSDFYVNGVVLRQTDVDASNGVMHKITRALVPPPGNLFEMLTAANGGYDSLAKALTRATTAPDGDPAFAATLRSTMLTFFAPSNQAFSDWLDSLSLTSIEEIPVPTLLSVLQYQVTPGRYFAIDLSNGPLAMLAGGNTTVSLNIVTGLPALLGNGNDNNRSNVTLANAIAINGVVHVIDRVMLP